MFSIILLFFNQCTLLFFSFGSKLRSLKSGIIYNNELADYFTNSSYTKDENGKERPYPKPTVNAPLGGRRPLSSTCPSVIVDNNGDVKMVVGGSGGTRITLSTAWVRYVYNLKVIFLHFLSICISIIPFADAMKEERFSSGLVNNLNLLQLH